MKRFAGLTLLVLSLVACAPAEESPPEPVEVRVGYLVSDLHHISHIVAQDAQAGGGTSFYDQFGLVVRDALGAPYANGGVEMDHFASGDVDIGMLGAPPAITKHLNAGIETLIVGQVNEIGSALIVADEIDSFADLAGKTVATPGHSTIQYFLLLNYAQQQGVDIADITVVDLPPKDMRGKLEAGDLAGFIVWEPFASDAVVGGFAKVLATSQDIWPNHLDCVVATTRDFAAQNPEVVERFLAAHRLSTAWVLSALERPDSADYQQLVDLAVTFTGREAEVVKQAFGLIRYKAELDAGFAESLTEYASKLIEFNIVASDRLSERGYGSLEDFASKYIDTSFLEAAQER